MRNIHQEIFEKIRVLIESEHGNQWADWNNDGGAIYAQSDTYRKLADLFIEMLPEKVNADDKH